MNQRQGRATERKGRQILGRQRTQQIRHGLIELEVAEDAGPNPGVVLSGGDLGPADDIDGDLLLDGDEGAVVPDAEDEETGSAPRQAALADLIGTRPTVVLLRLHCTDGVLTAETVTAPRSGPAAEALEELRLFVEHCFRVGPADWSAADRARLLGEEPAPLSQRLLLLSRLAVKANDTVAIAAEHTGAGALHFTPHDRGLQRYAAKFAALPDGLPFSIRLLLQDGRGRARNSHPFDQLPLVVKLLALRRVLHAERQEGRAADDEALRDQLRDTLEGLGVPIGKPTWRHITRLREALQRQGLGHLFPNRLERQRAYDTPVASEETS